MKRNTQKKGLSRAVITRLLLGVLLLGILGGVLTSCSGGTTRMNELEVESVDVVDGANMTTDAVKSLANKIAKDKKALIIREKLVAAQNGYNIADDDDYNDSFSNKDWQAWKEEEGHRQNLDRAAEYAQAVLDKYDLEPEFKPDAQEKVINAQSLAMLVDSFKTEVKIDATPGVLGTILNWIGIGFGWLINVPGFGNFILGTLYFAIALEILMLPLGIRQQKNSRKQAKLRPREMAIRNKYKGRNDKATMMKLNEEIRTLYASEGYSPMSGCLPLLITMPFLIFLYYIVLDPMVYMMGASESTASAFLTYATSHPAAGGLGLAIGSSRGTIEVLSRVTAADAAGLADFAFFTNGTELAETIKDMLSNIPDFSLFGMNMGEVPRPFAGNLWLMLIPVLTFLVYWGSGKLTRKLTFQPLQGGNDPAQGCSNGMMNIMMPAMSAFFTFMVPAAIGIYWMFKSVVATAKQFIICKVMPLPVFTEEDYKAAERELAGKDKNKPVKKSGTRNPNVRSLHHIDDEDYETETNGASRKVAPKGDYAEPEEEAKPLTADNAYSAGVTLKEDRSDGKNKKDKTDN